MSYSTEKSDVPEKFLALLNEEIVPFHLHQKSSYELILNKIGDARLVLLGEATHGTHEFYQARIELSKYLIREKGFQAIAIEGDWTSCYKVQEYLQGLGDADDIETVLQDFNRFPKWMWRNTTFLPFLKWLRSQKISFFGLDLYCLHASIEAVLNYLKQKDEKAYKQATEHYACLEQFSKDPQRYGYLVEEHFQKACIKDVTEQLMAMQNMAFKHVDQNTMETDHAFYAVQNARLIKNAEHYYRTMFEGRDLSWNVRDEHMAETLENIIAHLENKLSLPAKIIVWAHNSHVGDARATEMSEQEELNLGQIVRERFSFATYHLGFSTHSGHVMAADHWDGYGKEKKINPGMKGSYEHLFHALKYKNFFLDLHGSEELTSFLKISRLMRAIGVIYKPFTERHSHYFFSKLLYQFDGIIHIDHTTALEELP